MKIVSAFVMICKAKSATVFPFKTHRVTTASYLRRHANAKVTLLDLCISDDGQDIAEYAVMLAVILVLVVGTVRLIGSHANNVFSSVASDIP